MEELLEALAVFAVGVLCPAVIHLVRQPRGLVNAIFLELPEVTQELGLRAEPQGRYVLSAALRVGRQRRIMGESSNAEGGDPWDERDPSVLEALDLLRTDHAQMD